VAHHRTPLCPTLYHPSLCSLSVVSCVVLLAIPTSECKYTTRLPRMLGRRAMSSTWVAAVGGDGARRAAQLGLDLEPRPRVLVDGDARVEIPSHVMHRYAFPRMDMHQGAFAAASIVGLPAPDGPLLSPSARSPALQWITNNICEEFRRRHRCGCKRGTCRSRARRPSRWMPSSFSALFMPQYFLSCLVVKGTCGRGLVRGVRTACR